MDSAASVDTDAVAEKRIVHLKPPIIVRDFAGEIGLKPFKLISELMEMGIFASMNQTIEESTALTLAERHGCQLEIHHRGEERCVLAPQLEHLRVEVLEAVVKPTS